MSDKIGVYICTGCGIGESLDIEKLSGVADDLGAAVCKNHPVMCSEEGVALIKEGISSEGVNKVAVAACSPRVKYEVFDFKSVLVDRINLREQVVWCHPPKDEDTQMLAEDQIRMGVTKLQKSTMPTPFEGENLVKDLLVVGGGITGLTAALEAAGAGYKVHLVEKEDTLGGFRRTMFKMVSPPFKAVTETGIEEMIKQVQASDKISLYTKAEVESIEGAPGMFDVTIRQNGSVVNQRVGAIIQATGWKPYDPTKLGHLGYGISPDVITNVAMEEMAKKGKIVRPSDGGEVKNVVFVQCAGSRDPEHLPYCSSVCCLGSLKQATYLKEQNPETQSYIIYKDIRTPGQSEDFYRKVQKDGAVFIRGEVQNVSVNGGRLRVEATDVLLNEKVLLEDIDLVVLATGMVPSTVPDPGQAVVMPPAPTDKDKEGKGEEVETPVCEPSSGYGKAPALNLKYRQGPELPNLRYGFPDSNFICFPYETQRTAIYAAGCVRAPMSMNQAKEDGAGAALKAIQAVESVAVGAATFPRSGDLSYPEFYMQRCTQCKRCTEECPFGAINEDEKANPLPNPTRCRRCGTCMGACPERIISFKNYSVDMIGSMIKALEVPEEDEEKPRAVVLVCENDAYPALDMAGIDRLEYSPFVRFIPVRCLGSVNLVWIADALSRGIDGILLLGCRKGEDYQCHFVKGSELANIRMSKISETLNRLALESDRVRVEEVSIMDYKKIPQIINDFMETLEQVGPNPYKGF
jgi:quinone-modifying oxidoreductase subunit QmoB